MQSSADSWWFALVLELGALAAELFGACVDRHRTAATYFTYLPATASLSALTRI